MAAKWNMESKRVRKRGSEIVAEECAGNCHSCYLLVMSDKCQSNHVASCVLVVT